MSEEVDDELYERVCMRKSTGDTHETFNRLEYVIMMILGSTCKVYVVCDRLGLVVKDC